MTEAFVISICLALNGLFAAVEMAFVTVTKARLREVSRSMTGAAKRDAKRVLILRENPERTLSIIQIGITIVGSIAAAVGGVGAMSTISPWLQSRWGLGPWSADAVAVAAVIVPITYINVVLGELVPKTLAIRDPLRIVLFAARWLVLFDRLFRPVVSVLEVSTRFVLATLETFRRSKRSTGGGDATTEQDAVRPSVELERLSEKTREYVLNLVDLETKRIRDVRLPWTNVIYVRSLDEADQVERAVYSSGHTRLPVVDNEDVVGIINTKEFVVLNASSPGSDWRTLIRPVVRMDEGAPILRALRRMQDQRSHLSITYRNGVISGIVTIEDIFEEIIGDIFDEDDDGKLVRVLSTAPRFRPYGANSEPRVPY